MMEIGDGLSETPLAKFRDRLFLNQPRTEVRYVVTGDQASDRRARFAKANVNDKESDLERALEVSESLKKTFSRANHEAICVTRQWPVGLFHDSVADGNYVFTGGKSAIDLIAVDGDTLLLFELKNGKNAKAGSAVRDVLLRLRDARRAARELQVRGDADPRTARLVEKRHQEVQEDTRRR